MSNIITTVEAFVEKEIEAVKSDFTKSKTELLNVATEADKVLNAIKAWTITPAGATLLSIIESIPGVGQYADEIVNTILPGAIAAVTTVQNDVATPTSATDIESQVTSGVTAILGKKDGDAVAVALSGIAAFIGNKLAPIYKVASTIQSMISVNQVVYAASKAA
jgi:hypothetical protein